MVKLPQKRVWQFLTKLKVLIPYNPVIMFLGIYPKVIKNLSPHINLNMNMFIAALS